jgi:carotenoid 1,2-hydratase
MDISFFNADNTKILANEPNAYEWWYADFMDSASGLTGVIIFYNGNLFSPAYIQAQIAENDNVPENFPAISISLYKDNKPYYYSFLEFKKQDASYTELANKVQYTVGENSLVFDTTTRSLVIKANQLLASSDTLMLDLSFTSAIKVEEGTMNIPSVQTNSSHTWKCIIPNATVEGQIDVNDEIFELKTAKGYHDHNAGLEPLHHFFTDWYWGRVHLPATEETLVFYSYAVENALQTNGWIIDKNGVFTPIKTGTYTNFKKNLFGFSRATKIQLSDRFLLNFDKIVDKGPFYERYICSLSDLAIPENKTSGIAEYIYPKSIYKTWAHKLVNLRMRYVYKKAHAVLKSKIMYRFTWKLL